MEIKKFNELSYSVLTQTNGDNYIEITGCNRPVTKVIIPDEIDGLPVRSIGNNAFIWCKDLVDITIADSVTSIGDMAFFYCESLVSITIPDSVTKIGKFLFDRCINLKEISVSEDNKYFSSLDGVLFNKYKTILVLYPQGNTNNKYTIPRSVTEIGDAAFGYCTSLESITIENPECKIENNPETICFDYDYITYKGIFNGTIYGYKNSTAQEYAEKYGYKFELLN